MSTRLPGLATWTGRGWNAASQRPAYSIRHLRDRIPEWASGASEVELNSAMVGVNLRKLAETLEYLATLEDRLDQAEKAADALQSALEVSA